MMGIGLPIKIKPKKTCERCRLKRDHDLLSCPHCSGMGENQLAELKEKHLEQLKANEGLGFQFLAISILIAIVFLALAI